MRACHFLLKLLPLFIFPVYTCAGDIEFSICNIKSDEGFIMIALYDRDEDFSDNKAALAATRLKAQKGYVTAVFKNTSPGTYAIKFFHDQNNNEKLDMNLLGLPTEPYGFSQNAEGSFGLPDFKAASFVVGEGMTVLNADVKSWSF